MVDLKVILASSFSELGSLMWVNISSLTWHYWICSYNIDELKQKYDIIIQDIYFKFL